MTIRGREWTLGKPLGQGGFGAIYLTQPGNHKQVDSEAEYVVKVANAQSGKYPVLDYDLDPGTSLEGGASRQWSALRRGARAARPGEAEAHERLAAQVLWK